MGRQIDRYQERGGGASPVGYEVQGRDCDLRTRIAPLLMINSKPTFLAGYGVAFVITPEWFGKGIFLLDLRRWSPETRRVRAINDLHALFAAIAEVPGQPAGNCSRVGCPNRALQPFGAIDQAIDLKPRFLPDESLKARGFVAMSGPCHDFPLKLNESVQPPLI